MKKLSLFMVLLYLVFTLKAQPATLLTFDLSNWLAALDQMYATYDQIMNQVQSIQAQYEQTMHFINEAKSWEFDNIQWDGDWDFRNEINQANRSINRQLTNIRKVEEAFTTDTISLGGWTGTLKDLVSPGGENNLIAFFGDQGDFFDKTIRAMMDPFVNGLNEKQKTAIWRKYGISPANYLYMQKKKEMANKAMEKVIAKASDKLLEEDIEKSATAVNNIVSAAMGEDVTEKSLAQNSILMQQQLIEQLEQLKKQFADVGGMLAWQVTYEKEQKENEERLTDKIAEPKNNAPGSLFSAGTQR